MENCVIYIRMSTEKQDNSVESQKQVLKNFAEVNNYKIIKEYIDEGISGRSVKNRSAFLQMIEDSYKNMFTTILIFDTSRFARNLEEFIVYKSELKRNNIKLLSVTEPINDDDTSILIDAMLGALNEMHSRKLSTTVKRGMLYKAKQGFYQTPPPFGYIKKNNIIITISSEAEIVKKIFDLFLINKTYYGVATKLNEIGLLKRKGGNWNSTDIKRVLNNKAYIGYVFYNNKYYKGNHENIISKEIFSKTQKIIKMKNRKEFKAKPENIYKHWLSGIIKCYYCNSNLTYNKDKNGNIYYRCSYNRNGKCNYSNFISVKKLEALLLSSLREITIKNTFYSKYNEYDEKKDIQKSIKNLDIKLKRCKNAYINNIDTLEEYSMNKNNLMKEKEKLEFSIKLLKENNKLKIRAIEDLLLNPNIPILEKNIVLKSIIHKIILDKYNKKFIIYYYI